MRLGAVARSDLSSARKPNAAFRSSQEQAVVAWHSSRCASSEYEEGPPGWPKSPDCWSGQGPRRPLEVNLRRGGHYVRLLAARGLVGLGARLLQMVAHAYRGGYLDLRQVECCVCLSRRLRRHACHLIGASAGNALPARAPLEFEGACRPEVSGCNIPVILLDVASQIGHSRAKPGNSAIANSLFY